MTLKQILKTNPDGSRFQQELAYFIISNDFQTIVETGYGVSSVFIIKEMEKRGTGMLYSIDPEAWYPHKLKHKQLDQIKQKSEDTLLPLFLKTGAWDMFIADGNHEIFNQTLESRFAWECLRKGGWLLMDDCNWNNNGAWESFCKSKDVEPFKLGSLEGVRKTENAIDSFEAKDVFNYIFDYSKSVERGWLAAGGVKADCFK